MTAGLLFVRGTPPQSSYIFKHALVQDAAYGTLLRSRRQRLHSRIAATLEGRFPEIVLAQPALLARHCAEAGLAEQAVVYWLKAAQQALARSAAAETVAQARKGLEILTTLPDSPCRREQELELQSNLAFGLVATKGSSATETVETLARAEVLAEQLDRLELLVPLTVERCGVHVARAEYRLAVSLGKQVEGVGKARNNVAIQMAGCLSQGISHLYLGELVAARTLLGGHTDPAYPHADLWSALFPPLRLASLGLTLTSLGYIDQARSQMGEALSLARRNRSPHVPGSGYAMGASWLDLNTGSPLGHAEELLALSTEQKFPRWLSWALAFRGVSLAALGQSQEAFALLTQALAQLRAIGVIVGMPRLLAWLANVSAMLGRPSEAWNYLAEAAQLVEATDERISEAEVLHRIPGDLLKAAGDRPGAERHYRHAITVAERQSAKVLQLRASSSLAQLWRDEGRHAEARDLLAPIYNWFTEGFDAPVLKDAKALWEQLTA